MSHYCGRYKLLEIPRLRSHADMCTIELSQVIQLLRNTTEIVL